MIGFLIRLLLLAAVIYAVVRVVKTIQKWKRVLTNPLKGLEECPACHRGIQVSGDDIVCPHCHTKLGRTKEGKLVIRVN